MKLSRTRLVAARRAAHLSQPELARSAGVNLSALRQFEQGRNQGLKVETVYKIARALDVPMEALFEEAVVAATGGEA